MILYKNIFMRGLAVGILFLMCSYAGSSEIKAPDYAYWDSGKLKEGVWYDEAGNVRVRRWFRGDGSLEKREKYDARKHKIEECNYDGSGRIEDNMDGWAAMRWYYDEAGKLRAQVWYGEDGKVKERKFYSEGGNLVDTQFMGEENIDPDEEHSDLTIIGTHAAEYYDDYGNRKYTMASDI